MSNDVEKAGLAHWNLNLWALWWSIGAAEYGFCQHFRQGNAHLAVEFSRHDIKRTYPPISDVQRCSNDI